MKKLEITVVGMGYVGLSHALLLAQHNEVIALDIDENRVSMINAKKTPIEDAEIEEYLRNKSANLTATLNAKQAYAKSDFVVIATPTDYDLRTNCFNTETIENVVHDVLNVNPSALLIIKSTVPVGYTEKLKVKMGVDNIIFSPEFLREGKALYDNLYPSRIIIGGFSNEAKIYGHFTSQAARKSDVPLIHMGSSEAEAVKLFANTYLALRVAYFNELDTYAMMHGMNTREIINGICLDPRIGGQYNNPSFGYGGYCLPKDTKQLLANYQDVPQNLIHAIVQSNSTRKEFIANEIIKKKPKVVGIYRLAMKLDSDNFRDSSIQSIMNLLKDCGVKVIIYEPGILTEAYNGLSVVNDIELFKKKSDLIVANRNSEKLNDVAEKVFSRDVFQRE